MTAPQLVRDASVASVMRRQGAPSTGPWDKNQGCLHMSKARRHRRVTLIMRRSWATTVGVSCTAGQEVSRWTQLPSDPAVSETASQWVTGLLSPSRPWRGLTRSEQVSYEPASWANPTPRPDKWFSEPEKAHFSCRSVLSPALSWGQERHLNAEPPSALIERESTNRRCNWVCGCPVAATELTQHPHTSWKCGVRVLGRAARLIVKRSRSRFKYPDDLISEWQRFARVY